MSSSWSPPPPPPAVAAEEEGGEKRASSGGNGRMVVGYALSPKKVDSFVTPSLLNLAKQRGIHLLPIDLTRPLLNQGPFRCIIHKLSTPDWNQQLIEYSSKYPNVPIIDPPQAVQRLHDRVSMLQVVADLQLPSSSSSSSFGIPEQICVQNTNSLQLEIDEMIANLKFPLIAKSLRADGSAKSHQMYLVFNREGLNKLEMEPPLVLQQFVKHGGAVFKVYVVGDYVHCAKRASLPDYLNCEDNLSLVSFSQISNLPSSPTKEGEQEAAPMPPLSFLTDLAKALREALKLHLFNFDVIRDTSSTTKSPNHYYIIDINYFPGYDKIPSYDAVFTDFLLHILHLAPSTPPN